MAKVALYCLAHQIRFITSSLCCGCGGKKSASFFPITIRQDLSHPLPGLMNCFGQWVHV